MIEYVQDEPRSTQSDCMEFHEVASIFPMMGDEEYRLLVASIKESGLREPIWTYRGKIIDGRNRYRACRETGVEPRYREWDGTGSLVVFVVDLNDDRRHLSSSQKAMVALEIERQLAKEAERCADGRSLKSINDDSITDEGPGTILSSVSKSAQQASLIAGASETYIRDARRIVSDAPELKDAVMNGLLNIPDARKIANLPDEKRQAVIDKIASGKAKNYRKAVEMIAEEERQQARDAVVKVEGLPSIYHCSIVNLQNYVEANTLDAIITDPPYPREYLSVYTDLAKFAAYALKPGGSLIAMVGQSYLPEILDMLREHLTYHWLSCYYVPGTTTKQWRRNIGISWKPLIWFIKGKYEGPWKKDVVRADDIFVGNGKDKNYHKWGQPVEDMKNIIEHFTQPGQFLCDPFVGGGSTAVAALLSGRQFIGCDIDEKCVETTIQQVRKALQEKEGLAAN